MLVTNIFLTRDEFVNEVNNGFNPDIGSIVFTEGLLYQKVNENNPPSIIDLPNWIPHGETNINHFGVKITNSKVQTENSNYDNVIQIQAAIDYQEKIGSGTVYFPHGYFRLSNTLFIHSLNITLQGTGDKKSILYATHTNGPVLQIMNESCHINGLNISASDSRKNSGLIDSNNFGILMQIEDIPNNTDRLKNTLIDAVRVNNQPSHGIVISCTAFTGTLNRLWVTENKGHGIVIDRGIASNMQNNEGISGLCAFNECQITTNEGHGLAFGNPNDEFTTQALRITVTNCEISQNATSPTVRYFDAEVYCRAIEVLFSTNVFKPVPGSGTSGVFIAGRNIHMVNNRFIDVLHTAIISSYDIFPTIGVYINGFDVISSPLMTSAINVRKLYNQSSEPEGIYINNYNMTGGVNKLIDSDDSMNNGDSWRIPRLSIGGNNLFIIKKSDQFINNTTSHINDNDLKFWISKNEAIHFTLLVEYSSPAESDFKCLFGVPPTASLKASPDGSMKLSTSNSIIQAAVVTQNTNIIFGSTNGSTRLLTIHGFVDNRIDNNSVGGIVYFKWAPVNTSNELTTVYGGLSSIKLNRII